MADSGPQNGRWGLERCLPPDFIKKLIYQKTYLEKVDGSAQKLGGRHLSRPRWPFWGLLAAILDFAGGAALQSVSKCPLVFNSGPRMHEVEPRKLTNCSNTYSFGI